MIQQLKHFKSINLRHLYIKKKKIRLMLHNCFHSFKTIIAFSDKFYMWNILQIFLYDCSCQRLIINNNCSYHFCGIMIEVMKIFSFITVDKRSFLENKRYNLLCTEDK